MKNSKQIDITGSFIKVMSDVIYIKLNNKMFYLRSKCKALENIPYIF